MEKYDYLKAVTKDVLDYIEEDYGDNITKIAEKSEDEFKEELYDKLYNDDHVTGGGSQIYTYDIDKAEQQLMYNHELFAKAYEDLAQDGQEDLFYYLCDVRNADVLIRKYLLIDAINNAIETLKKRFEGKLWS